MRLAAGVQLSARVVGFPVTVESVFALQELLRYTVVSPGTSNVGLMVSSTEMVCFFEVALPQASVTVHVRTMVLELPHPGVSASE